MNEKLSTEGRKAFCFLLATTAKREERPGDAFKLLLKLATSGRDGGAQIMAATAIKQHVPLDARRRELLQSAKETVKNEQVAAILDKAITAPPPSYLQRGNDDKKP